MYYITVKQNPQFRQMTLDELLFGDDHINTLIRTNETNTRTYEVPNTFKYSVKIKTHELIASLKAFNETTKLLHSKDRHELFNTFYIEKRGKGMNEIFRSIFKSQKKYIKCDSGSVCRRVAQILRPLFSQHGTNEHEQLYKNTKDMLLNFLESQGLDVQLIDFDKLVSSGYRRIDAPVQELKTALSSLKDIFEKFGVLYHTSAFAYIHGRSTVDAVKRHQENQSRWFAKYDLSNFFGSTNLEFVTKMFSMIFPFSEIVNYSDGERELKKALELAFLDNKLPQGTPVSPLITNIMMIPIDYKLSNGLRDFNKQRFVYTRYADDFTISSRYNFNFKDVEKFIVDTLNSFGAPFSINSSKTRYGSSSGSNWNLGVMLNRDNKITVGYQKKRRFKSELHTFIVDTLRGSLWPLSRVQALEGRRNYFQMIEGGAIDAIVNHVGKKHGVNLIKMIKDQLRT